MTQNNKIIIVLLAILIVGAAFYFTTGNYSNPPIVSSPNTIKLCFIRNTEDGGKATIVMNISGSDVTGKFDWLPAQKDSKTGSFTGTISAVDKMMMARTLDVWWDASSEGKRATEQLKIIMGEGNAAPGFGAMKDRGDGVYVYASPETIVYEPNLSDVDCATENLD